PPIFISIILSNYALGLYSAAYKLFGLYVMFLGQVMIILAPYLTKLKNMDRTKSINYSIQFILLSFFFGALIGITFFFLTEEIILLILGDGFRESIGLFKLINILLIPSWSVYMAIGSILIYNNLDKYILKCSIISVIVLLICGPLFLYFFGLVGIIYSLVLSNLATIALSGYFIKKYFFSRLNSL
ncbi:MAG TPA: oligosaccharide flippase family protein, partial [Ignavibacteriaceae bacterium]|nr:oligosaccharide flippase family protein [Ignavibacteriaceae bacterium]